MVVFTSWGLAATISADAGDLPGDIINSYTVPLTAPQSATILDNVVTSSPPYAIWSGPEGLNWLLNPGTYWVEFELTSGSAYYGRWPYPSVKYLGNEALSTNIAQGYNTAFDVLNIGIRIDGYVVPIPSTVLLLGLGLLAVVGLSRRFRKR